MHVLNLHSWIIAQEATNKNAYSILRSTRTVSSRSFTLLRNILLHYVLRALICIPQWTPACVYKYYNWILVDSAISGHFKHVKLLENRRFSPSSIYRRAKYANILNFLKNQSSLMWYALETNRAESKFSSVTFNTYLIGLRRIIMISDITDKVFAIVLTYRRYWINAGYW